MVEYSIIVAFPENHVIGNEMKIPWYIPEDFKHFKQSTLDSVVIMGKTTWDSLPIKPLPKRINIIISKEKFKVEGAIVCTSIPEALTEASKHNKKIFVIGGASIYKQMLCDATYLYISHIKKKYEGNVFFPEFNKNNYEIIEKKNYDEFTFKKYKKIS